MNDIDILNFQLVKPGRLGVEDELLRDISRKLSSNLAPVMTIFPDAVLGVARPLDVKRLSSRSSSVTDSRIGTLSSNSSSAA